MKMQASEKLITFIKGYEAYRPRPYAATPDEKKRGIYTLGYGMTVWPNGKRVGPFDPEITEQMASNYLTDALGQYADMLNSIITVDLTQNEFDAVLMWAFNIFDWRNKDRVAGTTLIQKLNAGDKEGAANEFGRWVYQQNKVLPGLVDRTADEKELFLFADYQRRPAQKQPKQKPQQA